MASASVGFAIISHQQSSVSGRLKLRLFAAEKSE